MACLFKKEEKMKKFKSFEDARKFVQLQNLQTTTDWVQYCRSGNKPEDIPSNPQLNYKKSWKSYGDWLRDGKSITRKSKFLSFEDAKMFVHKLNLKSVNEWRTYCKSNNKPDNITSVPERVYKNKGWIGLGDWLGNGKTRNFRSFDEARKFVHLLKIKSEKEWNKYCKSGNKPGDIPQSPKHVYKNNGYLNMGNWLGTGRVADQLKVYRSFEEARKFVRTLGLKNHLEWEKFTKSGNKPDNIPVGVQFTYKNNGWIDWGDFLGTENVSLVKKSHGFLSYPDARKFVRLLGLKSQQEWIQYCTSGKKPSNIPSNPNQVYSKKRFNKKIKNEN